jgi:uncharacterized membrane protein
MIPFVVLLVSVPVLWLIGRAGVDVFESWIVCLRAGVALMFFLTASAHWGKRRADLVRMVPAGMPAPELLVTITGWLEIAGAAGLLIPATAPAASAGLAALLIAVFPANVSAARRKLSIDGRPVPGLALRTVLQIVFIAAVLMAGFGGVLKNAG